MEFRVLGPLEALDDGRPVELGRGKHRALLAILLLHANEVVGTGTLIDALWGESPPPTAGKIVRNHVSLLRRALGTGADLLQTHAAGYSLQLGDEATLDSMLFEQLAESGRRSLADRDAAGAAAVLREALDLWRGPALADFAYEDFSRHEIGRLEELRLGTLEERIEADLRLGRHAELVSELETLVREHPLRERLRGQLMLALYRSGRQAEALAAYAEGRRALVDELGIEPGRALQGLERGILAQDSALDPPPPPGRSPAQALRARRGWLLVGAGACLLVAAAIAVTGIELRNGSAAIGDVQPDSLARIDPHTNHVTTEIPVGTRPAAVVPAFGSLWVANLDDATVSRVYAGRGRIGPTIPTGAAPTGLAAGLDAVWATGADGIVRRIDPRFNRVSNRVRTLKPGSLLTAGPASGAVAVDNSSVWAATGGYGAAPYLWRIDPRTNRPVGKRTTGNAPTAVATGLGSTWVADGFENTVTEIEPGNPVPTTYSIGEIGHGPSAIAVGEGAVWVTESDDDAVVRIDPKASGGAFTTSIPVGRYPTAVAVGNGSVWVANARDGTVSRIDPATNEVVKTVHVGGSPSGVAFAQGAVWVTVQAPAPPPPAVAKGGTLRVDYGPEAQTDPALYADPAISYATCARLLNYPDEPAPRGSRLVPEVARSLPTVSADGRTYTFRIRKGYRFSPPLHESVTAQSFQYAIERSLSPATRSLAAGYVDDIEGEIPYLLGKAEHISGVTAQGDRLTIRLVKRAPNFPTRLAMSFFCAVPRTAPIDRNGIPTIPSAGPYYVSSYVPHQRIVLKRNPNYSGPRPHRLESIVLTLGGSPPQVLADVESGRADYVSGLPTDEDVRLMARYGPAGQGPQRYFLNPSLALAMLALNTDRPLFSSPALRRAANLAIDRRALARLGSPRFGPGELAMIPTDQYLPPTMPGFERRAIYPLGGDPAAARRLVGAGRRTAVLYSCDLALCRRQAQQIGHDLGRIGIDVDVKEFPLGELIERATKPHAPFDILAGWWFVDYADPSDVLNVLLEPKYGLSHFDSAHANARLERVAQLSGPARYRAYGKLAIELARDDAPWVAYAVGTARDFFSARIGCQTFNPVYGMDLARLCVRRPVR